MSLRLFQRNLSRLESTALILVLAAPLLGVQQSRPAAETPVPEPAQRRTVLLELFTSEGCSSCPSADRLLRKLDREGSVRGAEVVVLSEHVDYWNHDGWVDAYSSPQFSKRQEDYASLLKAEAYTPQLVVDGRKEVLGSNRSAIERAIEESVPLPKTTVAVNARKEAAGISVHIEVGPVASEKPARIYLVLAADQARSHVMHGENAGKDLEHVAVVESLVQIGTVTAGTSFQKDVRSALPPGLRAGNLRVAVFVQDAMSKRVLGVAQDKL